MSEVNKAVWSMDLLQVVQLMQEIRSEDVFETVKLLNMVNEDQRNWIRGILIGMQIAKKE